MVDSAEQRRIRGWRDKAEECRIVADQMCDPYSRQSFIRMADSYDRLADSWERRATAVKKPNAG